MTHIALRAIVDMMSDNEAAARSACQALFNNMAFADVVVAADRLMAERDDGTVTTRQAAARLGLSDSVVRPVMNRLLAAGLLNELPKVGAVNGPRLFYRRNPERWTALVTLIASVTGAGSSADRTSTTRVHVRD